MTIYNFSAGPGMLPPSVLRDVQEEFLSFQGTGMSIVETSHRSARFSDVVTSFKTRLSRLMDIPTNYDILLLQGGATLQFSMIPMNLTRHGRFGYIDTGVWSKKAIADARRFGEVEVLATSVERAMWAPFDSVTSESLDYLHVTLNNTIEGTRYRDLPDVNVPLVADVSSNILAERIDVSRFGLLYAGAQKNIGPSGLTVVIKRQDLAQATDLPSYLDYANHLDLLNTPSTFSIYVAERVLRWMEEEGGVAAMQEKNERSSDIVYDYLDRSDRFRALVNGASRSLTNIPFTTGDVQEDKVFEQFAETNGVVEIGGHRSVGGLRASLYNAMPEAGARRLVDVMRAYEEGKHVSHPDV